MISSKRRFIAGAVCPRCKAMDTTVVWQQEGRDFRACVACDFEEGASFHVGKELPTRVNMPQQTDKHKDEQELAVVTIIDPKKNK